MRDTLDELMEIASTSRKETQGHILLRLEAFYAADCKGDWQLASKLIERAVAEARDSAKPLDRGLALVTKSYIECYAGNLLASQESAKEALRTLQSEDGLFGEFEALMNLAYAYHLQSKYHLALSIIAQAKKSVVNIGDSVGRDIVGLTEAEIASDLGKHDYARRLLRGIMVGQIGWRGPDFWKKYVFAAGASVLRRSGDYLGCHNAIDLGMKVRYAERHGRLGCERIALLCFTRPDEVRYQYWIFKRTAVPTEHDRALALYFLARSFFGMGEAKKAIWWANIAIRRAIGGGALQLLASELDCDQPFFEFLNRGLNGSRLWAKVESRLGKMRWAVSLLRWTQNPSESFTEGLCVFALGHMVPLQDGVRLKSLAPQERRLLVVLLERRSERSEVLGELIWPDSPLERQMSSLHTAVYRIRKALGSERLQFSSGQYRLAEDAISFFDVQIFVQGTDLIEHLKTRAEWFNAAQEMLALYKGPFMEGEDAPWVLERRAELELRYLDLAGHMVERR